jgi:genome maintenance exonuclease 1
MSEKIQRVVLNGFRYYEVSDSSGVIGTYPSVTSILGSTSDQTGLDAWRNRIGHTKAEQIGKDATSRGTVMHKLCELYLNLPASMSEKDRLEETLSLARLDDEIDQFDSRAKIVGGMLFYNYIKSGSFTEIKKVIAQEKFLWTSRDGGFAGTLDNLSVLMSEDTAIVDFKTARKPKEEKWIEDYKLQVSAYAVAVWDRLNIKVSTCRIWISNEQSIAPQHFRLSSSEMREYYGKFRERLADFYLKNPPIIIQ